MMYEEEPLEAMEVEIGGRRDEAIETFKKCFAVTVRKEYRHYQVDYSGATLSLRMDVRLSNLFPEEAPRIFISPPLVHPWMPSSGEVLFIPEIMFWDPNRSSLSAAVFQVISETKKFMIHQLCLHGMPFSEHVSFIPMNSEAFPEYRGLSVADVEYFICTSKAKKETDDELKLIAEEFKRAKSSLRDSVRCRLMTEDQAYATLRNFKDQVVTLNDKTMERCPHSKLIQLKKLYNLPQLLPCFRKIRKLKTTEAKKDAINFSQGLMSVEKFLTKYEKKTPVRAFFFDRKERKYKLVLHPGTRRHVK